MKNYLPIMVLLACAGLFICGIVKLFELRFKSGDVYPPYSTLRSDPLGAMAFYEGLQAVPALTVSRDFSTENRLPTEPGTVYLHLAAESHEFEWLDADLYRDLKNFLAGGGRLVIAYSPQITSPLNMFDDEDETNSTGPLPLNSKEKKFPLSARVKKPKRAKGTDVWINLEVEWGLHESFQKLPEYGDTYEPVPVVNHAYNQLPDTLEWHSGMIFTNCDPAWHVVYARGTNAVVVERQFGKGSVVAVSDSYYVSNEAMLKDRQAQLLAWLIGPGVRVVFDEAHLGITDSPGIVSLMRQYHLHGLAAGLLLLAGLFVWKNSTGLSPPYPAGEKEKFVIGKDSSAGIVNLLRRYIPVRDIFGVCFTEWQKAAASDGKLSTARLQQAAQIHAAGAAGPLAESEAVTKYNKISKILGNQRLKP